MDNQIKDLEKILKNLNESLLEKEERNKIKKFYYDEDIVGLLTQNILDQIELNEIHTKFNKELIEKEIGVKVISGNLSILYNLYLLERN